MHVTLFPSKFAATNCLIKIRRATYRAFQTSLIHLIPYSGCVVAHYHAIFFLSQQISRTPQPPSNNSSLSIFVYRAYIKNKLFTFSEAVSFFPAARKLNSLHKHNLKTNLISKRRYKIYTAQHRRAFRTIF